MTDSTDASFDAALAGVGEQRRSFLKKMAVGGVFAAPTVASFTMTGIDAVYAQTPSASGTQAVSAETTTEPATTTTSTTTAPPTTTTTSTTPTTTAPTTSTTTSTTTEPTTTTSTTTSTTSTTTSTTTTTMPNQIP